MKNTHNINITFKIILLDFISPLKYFTLLSFIFIFTSACSINMQPNLITAAEILKPGMSIELTRPIKVNPWSAYIYIQNGDLVSYSDLDQYYTYCRIEMFKPSKQAREIKPGKFIITKIISQTEYVMIKPLKLAMLGTLIADGTGSELYYTKLYLKSDINPDVELMSCEYWRNSSSFEGHVTLNSINQMLDGIFKKIEQE